MNRAIDELTLEFLKLSQQRKCRPLEVLLEYISEGRVKQEDYLTYVEMFGPLARKTTGEKEYRKGFNEGYSLGLAHSQVNTALMFPSYSGPHRYLDPDDITGIRQLYTARQVRRW